MFSLSNVIFLWYADCSVYLEFFPLEFYSSYQEMWNYTKVIKVLLNLKATAIRQHQSVTYLRHLKLITCSLRNTVSHLNIQNGNLPLRKSWMDSVLNLFQCTLYGSNVAEHPFRPTDIDQQRDTGKLARREDWQVEPEIKLIDHLMVIEINWFILKRERLFCGDKENSSRVHGSKSSKMRLEVRTF